jgi:hypothetical protein
MGWNRLGHEAAQSKRWDNAARLPLPRYESCWFDLPAQGAGAAALGDHFPGTLG